MIDYYKKILFHKLENDNFLRKEFIKINNNYALAQVLPQNGEEDCVKINLELFE